MNRIPKMSILLTILYTCRRSNGIPALHSISPVIGMEENAVSINQTKTSNRNTSDQHLKMVESASHPRCSDCENQRVRSHTVYVQGHSQCDKNVLCFIFRYKSVNSRSAIDRGEIGTYYVFNGHKMENVTTQKEKNTFEDLKKSLRTRILPWLYGNGFTCNNQIFLFEILQIKWSIDKKCELIKINQLLFFGKKIYLLSRWFSCLGRVLHIAIHTHVPYPLCACSIGDFLSRASKYLV